MLARNILICLLLACSLNVAAKTYTVNVELASIKAINKSERNGDEIYLSITKYSNLSDPAIFRVPQFPMHWLSKELPKVSNIELWNGEVKEDETVLLIFSLLEQDVPPWNVDDHIGSAKVRITNKNGELLAVWGQPNFIDQPKVMQSESKYPEYTMYGDDSEYKIKFKFDYE